MNKTKISRYMWTFLALGLSYVFTLFLVSNVFINNSPTIDRYALRRMGEQIGKTIGYIINPTERELQHKTKLVEQLASSPLLKEVAPGIKAASNENGTYVQISIDNVQYKEYIFTVKGKEVRIKVPVGEQPPSQAMLEEVIE